MVNSQMARMASRSCHISMKALMNGGRGGVRRCEYRGEFFTATGTPSITIEGTSCTRMGFVRYSSGNVANVDYAGDIDRSKFIHEVKIEMPDVGDGLDCE